jgi:hypothetical protein
LITLLPAKIKEKNYYNFVKSPSLFLSINSFTPEIAQAIDLSHLLKTIVLALYHRPFPITMRLVELKRKADAQPAVPPNMAAWINDLAGDDDKLAGSARRRLVARGILAVEPLLAALRRPHNVTQYRGSLRVLGDIASDSGLLQSARFCSIISKTTTTPNAAASSPVWAALVWMQRRRPLC